MSERSILQHNGMKWFLKEHAYFHSLWCDVMLLQFPHFHSRPISFIVQLFHENKIKNGPLEIILPNCARILHRGGFLAPKSPFAKKWTLDLHFLLWIEIETLSYCMTLHKCKKNWVMYIVAKITAIRYISKRMKCYIRNPSM